MTSQDLDKYLKFYSSHSEWLAKKDIYLVLKIIDLLRKSLVYTRFLILEIGVYKGAWSETILRNRENIFCTGIDPYPTEHLQEAKKIALECMQDLIMVKKFKLLENYYLIQDAFNIIHIDGKHTEDFVEMDLNFAKKNLVNEGVIIVDDFRNQYFPGVANAMYKFLNENDFKVLIMSENKAYICKTELHHKYYKNLFKSISSENIVPIEKYYQGTSSNYINMPTINGFPSLLCVG